MIEEINVYKSADGRFRTENVEGKFVIAEELKSGSVLTVFNEYGEVLDQKVNKENAEKSLQEYMNGKALRIFDSGYTQVEIKATCPKCGKRSIRRELDLIDTRKLSNVPAVPIYVCTSCGQGFYSLTKEYLKRLIEEHLELFSAEEKSERERSEEDFVNEVNEYIIRIFASKKLIRIKIDE
ncbi:MAG: hypothetical protein ACP5P2_00775 [Candidatus Micrarchaeia archaeon]|jgi:predicted RNA-binding Zn-ribbon protein involved in translation (DUF1610 family)